MMVKIGTMRGRFADETRSDWTGTGPRPLAWTAWYPADPATPVPPPRAALRERVFVSGRAIPRAAIAEGQGGRPLVLLSHGTGGTADGLAWFAEGLAAAGYLVLGIDHHGNTAMQRYRPEGFLCWWERAADLGALLTAHLTEGPFAGQIDPDRIHAAGFSLGGYSVLAAMGARTDVQLYLDWARGTRFEQGPREYPDLLRMMPELEATSPAFRASWARQGADFGDPRIRSGFLMAPAATFHAFLPQSLQAIDRKVVAMVGGDDPEAPVSSLNWLAGQVAGLRYQVLGPTTGHFVFLNSCTDAGRAREPEICSDAPGVNRQAVHQAAIEAALACFA